MNCAPFDLKDYFFGELNLEDRKAVERHLVSCQACRTEVDLLGLTRSAVLCMREEEPPRRIAFVSDKVFEPRWWQKIFSSGPQLGFASAAILAAAIVFHAVHQPAPAAPAVAQVDQKVIQAEVDRRVQAIVTQVVADSEARTTDQILQVVNRRLAASDSRYEMEVKTATEYLRRMQQQNALTVRRAMYDPDRPGAIQ